MGKQRAFTDSVKQNRKLCIQVQMDLDIQSPWESAMSFGSTFFCADHGVGELASTELLG